MNFGATMNGMLDLAVIEDPAVAEISLDPVRSRLLAELAEPASATMLAGKLGLPRQNVNYHLRALEEHGLVELVEERGRQHDGTAASSDRLVLRDLARGAGRRGA